MSHLGKKAGERKDKKQERMRASVLKRHEAAQPPRPTTDQWDVQAFKPGGPTDRNRHQPPNPD